MSKTKGQLRDAHNDLVLDNSRLRAVNGALLAALRHIEGLEARADGCQGMVDYPHLKAFRAAVSVARAAIAEAKKATGTQL